jgi:hypothetical protein
MWPKGIFGSTTVITPVLLARRCTVASSADRRGRPAGRAPCQEPGLVPGQLTGPGAQQDAGWRSKDISVCCRCGWTSATRRRLRGDEGAAAQAALGGDAVRLDRGAGFASRDSDGPLGGAQVAARRARSAADEFTPRPPCKSASMVGS